MFAISMTSPGFTIAIAILHVLLAGIVTVDVLLKKSDVRAATGWIAAAWFSPILGSLFYYMFGINRVTRRALKLRRRRAPPVRAVPAIEGPPAPANISLLAKLGERVTGCPLTGGNTVEILENGDGAYPAMLSAIGAAEHSVALASYIFRNDAAGRAFAAALAGARKRGVEVRVLLDSVGVGYFFPLILYRLRRSGVRAARFLHTWLPWRMPFLNMRDHRKLLVVDGKTAFVGGINIGAENYQKSAVRHHVADTHFRFDGPIARTVMDVFARDWAFATGETLDDPCWWPAPVATGPVLARGLSSGPDADIYKLEMILGGALSLARSQVRIVTPYFLPNAQLQFAIAQAVLRGVKVDIVLPAMSDQHIMQWAMQGHLRFFQHVGAVITLTPPPFDHSKLLTVDGEWSLIGSSNWDTRSFRLNFEFDLECCDHDFAARLDAIIDRKIAGGGRLSPEELLAQPVIFRLRDAAARLLMPYL